MEKAVIGLIAAIGAAAPMGAAQAAVVSSQDAASALRVNSVADLLEPAPANASAILAALDAAPQKPEGAADAEKGVQVAQWHHHHWHHHHWHHHHWHHHHWHHHHWGPGFYVYHHHHHHHNHWRRWHHHHHHHHHWGW